MDAAAQRTHERDQQQPGSNARAKFPHTGLLRLGIGVQVEQHQHEQEQHRDGTCVHDDVYHRQKLRIQQDVLPSDGEKSQDQVQDAVHRVFRKHHQQRGENGDGRKGEKNILGHFFSERLAVSGER